MIKKVDLGAAMGSFAQAADVKYVLGELVNGSQVKINKADLLKKGGVYSGSFTIAAGEKIDLPYNNGLILVQNASLAYDISLVLLYGNGNGKIIHSSADIRFFSEIDNAVCIFNTEIGTNYIVKNNTKISRRISIVFISITQ